MSRGGGLQTAGFVSCTDYAWIEFSEVESLEGNRNTATAVLQVDWTRRKDAYKALLGYATWNLGDGTLTRIWPEFWPDAAGSDDGTTAPMMATRIVNTRGVGYSTTRDAGVLLPSAVDYKQAEDQDGFCHITVQFETVPWIFKLDGEIASEKERFVVRVNQASIEYLSLPQGSLVYDDGATPPKACMLSGAGQILGKQAIRATWLQVPLEAIPFTSIGNARGSVNESEWEFPGFPGPNTFATETLLFLTESLGPVKYFPDGTKYVDITFDFIHRPQGHNKLPNAAGVYTRVRRVGAAAAGLSIYPTSDFDSLFVPGDVP